MQKKLIGIYIFLLLFISTLPAIDGSIVKSNNVDISITAGRLGLDIGFDILIRVRNRENTNITFFINITYSSIIGVKIDRASRNFTIEGDSQWSKVFQIGPQALINQVNITVEVSTIFTAREGFSIGRLHILI